MDTIDDQEEPYTDDDYDGVECHRSIIQQSLGEIAAEVETAMRDAHLDFPVGLTTPSSGALVMIVTTLDPSDVDWSGATAIVRQIVSRKLGGLRLRSRHLPCVMANAKMTAADITPNSLAFDTRS
jgi:hypothetical protein